MVTSTTSGSGGAFALSAVPGDYSLQITSSSMVLAGSVTLSTATADNFSFPALATLTVNVQSYAGAAISDEPVTVVSASNVATSEPIGSFSTTWSTSGSAPLCTTNTNGQCSALMPVGVNVLLQATANGETGQATGAANYSSNLTIPNPPYVAPVYTVSGTIDDSNGMPAADVQVLEVSGSDVLGSFFTNDAGDYTVRNLSDVGVDYEFEYDGQFVDLPGFGYPTSNLTENVTLAAPGTIAVTTRDTAGVVAGARVFAFSYAPVALVNTLSATRTVTASPFGAAQSCTTNASGSCTITALNGETVFMDVIYPDGTTLVEQALATSAGGVLTVNDGDN